MHSKKGLAVLYKVVQLLARTCIKTKAVYSDVISMLTLSAREGTNAENSLGHFPFPFFTFVSFLMLYGKKMSQLEFTLFSESFQGPNVIITIPRCSLLFSSGTTQECGRLPFKNEINSNEVMFSTQTLSFGHHHLDPSTIECHLCFFF